MLSFGLPIIHFMPNDIACNLFFKINIKGIMNIDTTLIIIDEK